MNSLYNEILNYFIHTKKLELRNYKNLYFVVLFLTGIIGQAQVGIGTILPNPSAQLDIVSNDKGILIPHITLLNATDKTSISNGNLESLLVYNITTNKFISPGFYYWSNFKWNQIAIIDDIIANNTANNTTNTSLTQDGTNLIITDSDGNTVSILLSDVTTNLNIINNNDGTYTYIDATGKHQVIDVNARSIPFDNSTSGLTADDVQAAIEEINNGTNQIALVNNGDGTYLFTNAKGITTTITDTSISTFVNNNDGTHTYTDETGTITTINSSVILADNGLTKNGNTVQLGGSLIVPTVIETSKTNTIALTGLGSSNLMNDELVTVSPTTGVLSKTTASSLFQELVINHTAVDGQTQFATPSSIVDIKKVNVYRNGVILDFTFIDANTIQLESGVFCYQNDLIKIIQFN